MIAAGFGDSMQITKARFIGRNEVSVIPRFFQTGVLSLLLLALVFYLILSQVMPGLLLDYSYSSAIAEAKGEFLGIRSFALFFSLSSLALMSFLMATGKTQIVFVSSILMSTVNII